MDVRIGSGDFRLDPLVSDLADQNLEILIERQDRRLGQVRYCDATPSEPDPLVTKITAETNLMFYSPLDPGASVTDVGYTPNRRQQAEMGRMLRRFLRRAALADPGQINAAIQDAFGTYKFDVPWDDILDDLGKQYAIAITSVVQYRRFFLPQTHSGKGQVLVSVPVRARHFARRLYECSETGKKYLPPVGADKVFEGDLAKPKTDGAKTARGAWEKARRGVIKRKMGALRKELRELDAERDLTKNE